MRILITGGAGFIGSHTAELLLAQGLDVTIYDDLSTGKRANVPAGATLVQGDVRDFSALAIAMRGCDAVLHLAAVVSVPMSIQRPHFAHEVNATGTLNALEAARYLGIDRVVIASSAAVYGASKQLPLAEALPPEPLSPYAAQKWLAEAYAATYAALHGMSPICLRYFNVYGPRQDPASPYSGVLSRFIGAALAREQSTLHGDGRQTRDFIYVGDVARANVRALLAPDPAPGLVFNVGTGRAVSVAEAYALIARLTGAPPAGRAPARAGDVPHSRADVGRARTLLGFAPCTSFEAGLEATLAWAQQRLVPTLPMSA
ncbi:MAG: nucleoside-diphosphate-sugar epimerase [Cyanobacteria bacterium RYN_339]|nr:nucleoside-diphosphate-sugar epimerase [Cyanobacteria bacterium RYN_339]